MTEPEAWAWYWKGEERPNIRSYPKSEFNFDKSLARTEEDLEKVEALYAPDTIEEKIVKPVAKQDLSMQSDQFRMGFVHAIKQINRMLDKAGQTPEGDTGSD